MLRATQVLGTLGALALGAAALLTLGRSAFEGERLSGLGAHPLPARGAIVRNADLTGVAVIRYVNDHQLTVIDDRHHALRLDLTEDCPGLRDVAGIDFVTDGTRSLDRFTAIAVGGRICTFRRVSPLPPP